jgi:4-hydroxy-tetrahydrodipicolinate synthase
LSVAIWGLFNGLSDNTVYRAGGLTLYPHIAGFIPPLVTPVTESGNIARNVLSNITNNVVQAGANAVFALGTSAESSLLSDEQQKEIVDTVIETVRGRIPVLVGVSDTAPARVKARMCWAKAAGAAALVVCPPYYFPFTQTEIRTYILDLLEATDLPIVLYNIPSLAHNQLSIDLVAELASSPRVLGIKDSSGDFMYFQRLLYTVRKVRTDFTVMQGRESLSAASLLMGADGIVPGLGNLVPELCVHIIKAAQAFDVPDCRILQAQLTALESLYDTGAKAIAGLKAALSLTGLGTPWPVAPNDAVDSAGMEQVRRILTEAGLMGGERK